MTLHPEFFDLVSNVRSMRRLKSDPVPEALLMQVLNAGMFIRLFRFMEWTKQWA